MYLRSNLLCACAEFPQLFSSPLNYGVSSMGSHPKIDFFEKSLPSGISRLTLMPSPISQISAQQFVLL